MQWNIYCVLLTQFQNLVQHALCAPQIGKQIFDNKPGNMHDYFHCFLVQPFAMTSGGVELDQMKLFDQPFERLEFQATSSS